MTAMRTDASTGELREVPDEHGAHAEPGESATAGTGTAETSKHGKDKVDAEKPTMHIKIYSPFKTYFDEDGYSITGANATGPFDILPHHHNFMSLLTASELIVRPVRGGQQKLRISGGLMHVKADQVIVFLDI